MKKIRFIILVCVTVILTGLLSSCTDNTAKHIPEDAFAVVVIDGKELLKLTDPEIIAKNEDFIALKKEYEKDFEKTVELVDKILKDPNKSGILLKEKIYGFASFIENEILTGVIIPINKTIFEDNLGIIGKELGLPLKLAFRTKNDIKYFQPDNSSIIAYTKDKMIIVYTESKMDSFELAEMLFNQEKSKSILNDKDFKAFLKNCTDVNLWVSSNVIKNIDDVKEDVKEFNKLTGIDLENNYGHFHLNLDMKEIVYVQKVRFNKSIENLDLEKLIENSAKLVELFEDPFSQGMKLFGSSYNDYYDDYWDDYIDDEWEESEFNNLSDEELEAWLEELMKEPESSN